MNKYMVQAIKKKDYLASTKDPSYKHTAYVQFSGQRNYHYLCDDSVLDLVTKTKEMGCKFTDYFIEQAGASHSKPCYILCVIPDTISDDAYSCLSPCVAHIPTTTNPREGQEGVIEFKGQVIKRGRYYYEVVCETGGVIKGHTHSNILLGDIIQATALIVQSCSKSTRVTRTKYVKVLK